MISMLSPEFRRNPFPMYQTMLQKSPVLFIESLGVWAVFGYDNVKRVLSDHARFSSSYGQRPTVQQSAGEATRSSSVLVTTDPPRHTELRSLVNRAFTPRAVAALEPRIQAIASELLDKVENALQFDVIRDYAYPLPVIVIAELLGIPAEDRDRFKHWSDQVVASADSIVGGQTSSTEAHEQMGRYFYGVIQKRKQHPQDDLISALLAAQEGEARLSEADILSLCWLLLVAGNETTTNLIGNAVLTFLEQPEALQQVMEDESLLPSAIEETLRYRSPVQAMFRRAVEDVELGGQVIPANSRVVAFIGSANRDEAKFPEADRFIVSRTPNQHIAFGHGIHFCLGAPLARLEARVALGTLLRRFTNLRRANDDVLTPAHGFIVHGVTNLPVRFDV